MRIRNHAALWIVAGILLAVETFGATYIIDESGKKRDADAIAADASGNLKIKVGNGGFSKRYTEIQRVVTDKPRAVGEAENALEAGDYEKVLSTLTDQLFAQQRFLGWGAYIQHLRARALLGLGRANEAESKLRDGMQYASREGADGREGLLKADLVQALVDQDKNDMARQIISSIKPTNADQLASLYNMQGKMLAAENKKREALLKHLTVVMVFEKAPTDARRLAYDESISLMKELKDQRYGALEQMKKQEMGQ